MSEFSNIEDLDLDELLPAGEQPAAPKEEKVEREFVRPEPVSPAPPPSAGSGSDLFREEAGASKGISSPSSYFGQTYKDLGITIPDNLKEDLGGEDAVAPQTEIQKGMVAPSLFTEGQWGHAGKVAFDMVGMRDKVADARTGSWTQQFMRDNKRPPTQEEVSQKYIEFAAQANDEIYAWANKARGARASALPGSQGLPRNFLWVNTDPRGKLYGKGLLGISVAKQEDRNFISKVAAPFIVSLAGVEQDVVAPEVDEEGRTGQKMIKTPYNESHALGFLDWISRQSALSYLSTAAVAGASEDQDSWAAGKTPWALINPVNYYKGWGSDKQLELLSRGEDIVSLADELQLRNMSGAKYLLEGAEAIGLISPETSNKGQQIAEFATAFGLALADPDLFSLMTFGFGKMAKAQKLTKIGDFLGVSQKAAAVRRRDSATQVFRELEELATSPDVDLEDLPGLVFNSTRGADPQQQRAALSAARMMMGSDPQASRLTEALAKGVEQDLRIRQLHPKGDVRAGQQAAQRSAKKVAKDAARIQKDKTTALKAARKAEKQAVEAGDSYKAKAISSSVDDLKSAQLQDMWATSLLSDLKTQKRVLDTMKAITRASKAETATKESSESLVKTLEGLSGDIQKARKDMADAFIESPKADKLNSKKYAEAKTRLDKLNGAFNDTAMKLSTLSSNDAETMIKNAIASAEVNKIQSAARVKQISSRINKQGLFKVDPSAHINLMEALAEKGPEALQDRAVVSMLAVAYREQAAAYDKLVKVMDEVPAARGAAFLPRGGLIKSIEAQKKAVEEGIPAAGKADDMYMIEQIELASGYTVKTGGKKPLIPIFNTLLDTLQDFYNPSQQALGPMSKQMHRVGITLLNNTKLMQKDIGVRLKPAIDKAGKEAADAAAQAGASRNQIQRARKKAEAAKIIEYITSSQTVDGTIMNTTFNGRDYWSMAKPMLNASAKMADPDMAFNALYKMWLPPGLDTTQADISPIRQAAESLLMYGEILSEDAVSKLTEQQLSVLRQAGRNIQFEDFAESLRVVTSAVLGKTFRGVDPQVVDSDTTRVYTFAAQAIAQMALVNKSSTKINKILSDFPQDSIDAAIRLASGDSLKPGQDFVEATKILNKLKVPKDVKRLEGLFKKQVEVGLRIYSDGDGYKAIVPHQFMKQTSEILSNIEKTMEAYSNKATSPAVRFALDTYRNMHRIWHSAILTGLFIPRAAYFTNIYVGNFSQLLATQGFMAAARYSKESAKDVLVWMPQQLARQTPLGKYVDAATAKMDAKLGTEFHLSSLTNAILNRHISMVMDPSIADDATKVTGKAGITYTLGELRQQAVDNGVFSSFVMGSGLANLMSRTNPGFGKKLWDKIKQGGPLAEKYADFADTLEQRQRVGLFTDLIVNRGMTPEKAGEIVKDALYDFDSPMTEIETLFASHVFLFYNFTRRAMGQGMRILLDPYVSATKDTAAEAVLRSSPVLSMLADKPAYQSANVMAMDRARRELSEYLSDEDTEAEYPWWAKKATNKMFLPNVPMGEDRSSSYSQTLGKDVNYKVTTIPSFTPIEMINQWADMARILGAYGVAWAVDTPANILYPEGARPSTVSLKEDVILPMMEKVAQQGGPVFEEFIQGLVDDMSGKQSYISGGVNVNRLSDRKILEWLEQMGPFMSGIAWEDAKNPGRVRTDEGMYAALKLLPTISNDVNTLIGPYLDVSAEGGEVSEALLETLTSYLGFKTYRYNPQKVREWDKKTVRDKMSAIVREEKRKIPLGSTKPEIMPAQKVNLLEEEGLSEFTDIEDLLLE